MHRLIVSFLVLVLLTSVIAGCGNIIQKNTEKPPRVDAELGIVVGSITAPPALHYHDPIKFFYRLLGDRGKHKGLLTSGERHNLDPFIPNCEEDGLPQECGRLFAVSLPEGKYEIFRINVRGREDFQKIVPAVFSVQAGDIKYLGNLHVTFCTGLVMSTRGNILGADVSIKDEFERDVPLLRKRFSSLPMRAFDKALLPDYSWSWRVSYQPYDWGTCDAQPNEEIQRTP